MNASTFRDKVRHAGFIPRALAQYLVAAADTLKPDVRERIAAKIDTASATLMAAAKRAADSMTALENKAKKGN
jgi:hypothetical protein